MEHLTWTAGQAKGGQGSASPWIDRGQCRMEVQLEDSSAWPVKSTRRGRGCLTWPAEERLPEHQRAEKHPDKTQ